MQKCINCIYINKYIHNKISLEVYTKRNNTTEIMNNVEGNVIKCQKHKIKKKLMSIMHIYIHKQMHKHVQQSLN